ncbi:hypothetical protein GW17_00040539 [Ensete ventricosum]|nr:hypothetical protein GW17_00040539 [Ensete ventricosum]
MSAFSGLKLGISSVEQDEVVMISIASLIVLFSIQRPVRRRQRKHRFSASTVEVVATHEIDSAIAFQDLKQCLLTFAISLLDPSR